MHEMSLMNSLMNKIEAIAAQQSAKKVVGVKVKLGALSHMSPDHFTEHFNQAAAGTISEQARLDITVATDQEAADAQDIVLESIEVEDAP